MEPKCPSTDEWINKMWSLHRMEYYSVLRRENLTHTRTWMNFENAMLNEKSQIPKGRHCMVLLICGIRLVKFTETESRMMVSRGWGRGNGNYCLMGTQVQFWKQQKFWKCVGGDGCTPIQMDLMSLNCTQKYIQFKCIYVCIKNIC